MAAFDTHPPTMIDHAIGAFCVLVIGLAFYVIACAAEPVRPPIAQHCSPSVCEMPIDWRPGK